MKRILLTLLMAALILCFSGCKDKTPDPIPTDEELTQEEVVTETDLEDVIVEEPEVVDNPETDNEFDGNTTNTTKPAPKDEYDPPRGENHTITGVPDPIDEVESDNGDVLVLVNKLHAVSDTYKPTGMVYMDNNLTTWENLELKEEAYTAYKKMYNDAKELGYNLKVCSAYRTYKTQVSLFNNSVANRGWETTYLRSAYPGRSEHHTGLSVDITSKSMGWNLSQDFADYEDGEWLNTHCQDYGFIVRYPKNKTDITGYAYEPWHFRYVGEEVAKYIMENDLTLEEYLEE